MNELVAEWVAAGAGGGSMVLLKGGRPGIGKGGIKKRRNGGYFDNRSHDMTAKWIMT